MPSPSGPLSLHRLLFIFRGVSKASAWLLMGFVVYATLSPIADRPTTHWPANDERFAAYLVLAAAFVLGYPRRPFLVLLSCGFAATTLEVLQAFDPTRHGRPQDALVKALGVVAGVAVAMAFNAVIERLHGGQPAIADRRDDTI